ncbi:hypothetical protein TNCV_3135921 [Trichonephila clavipes]|nr:hypothetical protein TNCV_3135921 [Trichonephila clavipes]
MAFSMSLGLEILGFPSKVLVRISWNLDQLGNEQSDELNGGGFQVIVSNENLVMRDTPFDHDGCSSPSEGAVCSIDAIIWEDEVMAWLEDITVRLHLFLWWGLNVDFVSYHLTNGSEATVLCGDGGGYFDKFLEQIKGLSHCRGV